jgi:hypothetical protein
MIHPIRSRLTFANVTSLVALFVALGGSSYAALQHPENSVGPRHLKTNSVTSPKVKRGIAASERLPKVAALAVAGPSGSPGTAGSTGHTGGAGEQGPPGERGPSHGYLGGPSGVVLPTGKYLSSGRAYVNNGSMAWPVSVSSGRCLSIRT